MKTNKIRKMLGGGILMAILAGALLFGALYPSAVKADAATNYWAQPATVKRVDQELLNTLIDPRADGKTRMTETINGVKKEYTPARETYSPQDRQWQGLPSAVCTGRRIWTVWYTGGSGEPRQFNYLVIAYSDDGGKNWVDPYLVVDHEDPNHDGVSLGVPNFWMDGDDLCLSYIQYYTWVIRFHNPDAESVADVTWDVPVKLTESKIHKAPTFIKDADGKEIMMIASEAEAGDTHIATTRISVSADGGKSWQVRSNLASAAANNRVFPETQIAQTTDGTLIMMSRLEGGNGGGIERAISHDYGVTWEPYALNLNEPYIGPGSKFHIMRLSSGNLFIVNHATTSSRASLWAYLSEDNGSTWSKIEIDGREDVSYPCAFEHDGKIYVTWDKGRYLEKEIRLTVLTEADVKAGEFGAGSSEKLIVSKLNGDYRDIVEISSDFERVQTYPVGTASSTIREKLPLSFDVKDNLGTRYTLTGTWKSSGYQANVAGTYYITFTTTLPSALSDTYKMLRVKVVLTEKAKGGCRSSASGAGIGLAATAGVAAVVTTAVLARRKKKN